MAEAPPAPPFTTLGDLEEAARARLTTALWDYVAGGAGTERSLRANREAFDRRVLRPRVLRDLRRVDPSTTLLGARVSAPFFVAPTAYHGAVHPDAEPGTARAAAAAGILAAFSTLSSRSLEEIAAASGAAPRWFQYYLQPDPAIGARLLETAERHGYRALVLTVDAPVLGGRDRQMRTGFAWEVPAPIGTGAGVVSPARGPDREGDVFRFRAETGTTWETLRELVGATRLPVVVKGILTAEDAELAIRAGARGLVVSNHGGRQLDGVPATLDVLPEVAQAVGGRAEVYLDGGVRRGSDVLRALALGARGVGLGRPVLWGLAVDGSAGVARVLDLLGTELAISMALAGCRSVAEIGRDLVEAPPPRPRPRRPRAPERVRRTPGPRHRP